MSRTMTITRTRPPPARVAPRQPPPPHSKSESESESEDSESEDTSYSPTNARNGNASTSTSNRNNPNPHTASNRAYRPISPLPRNSGGRRNPDSSWASSSSSPLFTPPSDEPINILSDDDEEDDEITFLGMGPPTRVVVKREDTIDLAALEVGDMEEDDLEDEDMEAPRKDKGKGKARASPSPSPSPEFFVTRRGRALATDDLFESMAPGDLDAMALADFEAGYDPGYGLEGWPFIPPESPAMSRIGSASRRLGGPLPSLYEESEFDPADDDWVEAKPRIKVETEEGNGSGPVLKLKRHNGLRVAAGGSGGGPPGGSPPGAQVNVNSDSSDNSDNSDDDNDDNNGGNDGPRRIQAPSPDHDPDNDDPSSGGDDDDDDDDDSDRHSDSDDSTLGDQPDADGRFRRVGRAAVRLGQPKQHPFKPHQVVPGSGGRGGGSQSLHRKIRAKLLHGLLGNARGETNPLTHITLLYPLLNTPERVAEAVGADADDEVDEVMRTAANFQLYASKHFLEYKSLRRLSTLGTDVQANVYALLVGAVPPHDKNHLKHFKMLWPTASSWWAVTTWVGAQAEDKDRVLAAATWFRGEDCINNVRSGEWLG